MPKVLIIGANSRIAQFAESIQDDSVHFEYSSAVMKGEVKAARKSDSTDSSK